ncbi:hypothetical protein KI387_041052, partial [Taxus chinensis]
IPAKFIGKVIGMRYSGSEISGDLSDDEVIDATSALYQYKKGGRAFKVTKIVDMATGVTTRLLGSKLGATKQWNE